MYADLDDTSIYCIGESADVAVAALNNALLEVQKVVHLLYFIYC